jgi:hypothetical protein
MDQNNLYLLKAFNSLDHPLKEYNLTKTIMDYTATYIAQITISMVDDDYKDEESITYTDYVTYIDDDTVTVDSIPNVICKIDDAVVLYRHRNVSIYVYVDVPFEGVIPKSPYTSVLVKIEHHRMTDILQLDIQYHDTITDYVFIKGFTLTDLGNGFIKLPSRINETIEDFRDPLNVSHIDIMYTIIEFR